MERVKEKKLQILQHPRRTIAQCGYNYRRISGIATWRRKQSIDWEDHP